MNDLGCSFFVNQTSGQNGTGQTCPRVKDTPARPSPAQRLGSAETHAHLIEHNFLAALIGKRVEITLIFGDRIEGTISALGKYGFILDIDGREEFIFKHAIARISRATP